MHVRCPHCRNPIEFVENDPLDDVECPSCGSHFNLIAGQSTGSFQGEETKTIGHFQLIEQVGVGHFGSVWKARDTELDRIVAIKIPRNDQLTEAQTEQFLREARAAAQVKHANIVPVYEVGREGETVYIVSDFIRGANLGEWLSGQRLTTREAAELCVTIANAIDEAHQAGVVHRDLKPGNIMMDLKGKPYIADFGLAKRETGEITVTMNGKILGTPAYMSPEQAKGEGHQADRRSDIYSLGVILYQLLTGDLPFRGETRMLIVQILRDDPPSPRKLNNQIPRDLETICLKCLEKEPGQRYQTAKQLAEDLGRFLNGQAVLARPISQAARLWRWRRRNPLVAALMATVAASLFVGIAVSGYFAIEANNRAVALERSENNLRDERNSALSLAADKGKLAQEKTQLATEAMAARGLAESRRIALEEGAYSGYIATIGLTSVKVDQNAFEEARNLLYACPTEPYEAGRYFQDHWEWRRLQYLCNQAERVFQSETERHPIEAVALSPNGKLIAASGWSGKVQFWEAESGKELAPIDTGGQYVYALSFSPDGRYLATGTDDAPNYIKIWDLLSDQAPRQAHKVLRGHTDRVLSVVYSGDGKRLLTSSYDKTARLWDLETPDPTLLQTFEGEHEEWVWSAAFSPDEQRIVTASQDGAAIVWSVETGRPDLWGAFADHVGPVYCAAFSPDGRLVVSGGYDGRVLIWDPETRRGFSSDIGGDLWRLSTPSATSRMLKRETSVRELVGHMRSVRSVRFSADGERVLSGSSDNTVKVWKLANGELQATFRGHGGPVRCCVFVPNEQGAGEQAVLSGSLDHSVRLWKLAGHGQITVFGGRILTNEEGSAPSSVLGATFSSDGRQIVAAGQDGKARTFNSEGRLTNTFSEGHAQRIDVGIFFPDGGKLTTRVNGNTLVMRRRHEDGEIWEREERFVSVLSKTFKRRLTGFYDRMELRSRDGKYFLAVNLNETEITWNAEDAEQLGENPRPFAVLWKIETGISVAQRPIGALPYPLPGDQAVLTAAAISNDDGFLLTGDAKGRWFLWDAGTLKLIRRNIAPGADRKITAMWFLPDGKRFLTASGDSPAVLWDVETAEEVLKLNTGNTVILSVAFSADGQRAVAACEDRTIRKWDLSTGEEMRDAEGPFARAWKTRGHLQEMIFSPDRDDPLTGDDFAPLWTLAGGLSPTGSVTTIGFSRDGRRIVAGSRDATARIWDVETGKAVLRLEGGHTGDQRAINSAVYSPDGTMILTAADDTTAVLWDAISGDVVRRFEGHTDRVRCAVFSSDGKLVLTASDDKTARIWDVETGGIRPLFGHNEAVLCVAFSPDDRWIITAGADNSAKVWETETGEVIYTLDGHTDIVTSAAFSPNGLRAITGSEDETAKIWELQRGREILTLRGHSNGVTSVAFSPHEERRDVLTSSRDGTLILWRAIGLGEAEGFRAAVNETDLPRPPQTE